MLTLNCMQRNLDILGIFLGQKPEGEHDFI